MQHRAPDSIISDMSEELAPQEVKVDMSDHMDATKQRGTEADGHHEASGRDVDKTRTVVKRESNGHLEDGQTSAEEEGSDDDDDDDNNDDDDKTNQSTGPLATTRSRRANAGNRMGTLLLEEEDEFYANQYGGFVEDDDDDDFDEGEEEADKGEGAEDSDVDSDSNSNSNSDSGSESESDVDEADEISSEHKVVKKERCTRKSGNLEPKRKIQHLAATPGSNKIDPDAFKIERTRRICCVCLGDESDGEDEMIECDSCGVTVHEECYGVSDDDEPEADEAEVTEPWFCEPCCKAVRSPYCELCPNTGGIFKRTDTGRWVHMVCALYTQGVTFEDPKKLMSVSLFELKYSSFGSKPCTLCEDRRLARSGISIGCDAGLCKTFFHATCAQREGLLFESHTDEVDPFFAQCHQHADKSVIKRKKRKYAALFERLKRVEPIESKPQHIQEKLAEALSLPDPVMSRWTLENRPAIPHKVSRMLLTSPSVIIKLTKKSELLGLDPTSAFMTIQDEMEMARQKWHIPPAFNLEFVAYCTDRETRMVTMKKQHKELLNQNAKLKKQEATLRDQYNSHKESLSNLRSEIDSMIKQIRETHKTSTSNAGKLAALPAHLESLIEKCSKEKAKTPTKNSKLGGKTSTNTTYKCAKCEHVKDQHLLALCDTCDCHFHIYCLDPPLTRVPKKTKFGGWQCSDCSDRDEEEQEEALEKQNIIAIQEAELPRRLRERINAPDKYCLESMTLANFWSTSKNSKKKSRSSKSGGQKRPKVEA